MKKFNNIMRISVVTNSLLSIFKIIMGYIGKSSALIADGIHSFSDLLTDFFAMIGNYIAGKPADKKHPFGHGRLEYITSCGIGLVVLIIGFSLIKKSMSSSICIPSLLVIVVSFITILFKYFLSFYLIKMGKIYNNNILISSGKESRADVYSSIVVLISSILVQFSNKINIFSYSDVVATIIVGIFIIRTGFLIIKENLSVLIGEQESNSDILGELKNFILDDKNICSLDDLVMIKYGAYFKIIIEVSMESDLSLEQAHNNAHMLQNNIMKQYKWAKYITIHINPKKGD